MSTHGRRNARMLAETGLIGLGLYGLAAAMTLSEAPPALAALPALGMGFWMQRLYVVGHEAAHRKLLQTRWQNDLAGQLALLPILVPLSVFRAIHRFHHADNRRTPRISALDVFPVPAGAGPLRRGLCVALWYAAVFAGGWFLHGLVSVLLFLLLPPRLARRVSPAFRRWTVRDQLSAAGRFALGVGLHVGTGLWLGAAGWWWCLGLPLLVFAWVYSAQLYVYHYRTTVGPQTRFHARRLRGGRWVSWWLLNLNEHDTHHREPRIPWYDLPAHRADPPPAFAANHTGHTFLQGVLHQLRGPTIVEEGAP